MTVHSLFSIQKHQAWTELYKNHVSFVQQADGRQTSYTTWLAYQHDQPLLLSGTAENRGQVNNKYNAQQETNVRLLPVCSLYTFASRIIPIVSDYK